jgi:thiol-disulfide isomerase/thioredoxin
MKKLFAVLLFAGLLFGAANDTNATQGKKEVRFEVTTVEGQKLHFTITPTSLICDEAKGKVVILDFFGKHCPPCRQMIPVLGKVQKEMADKVLIVGLHVQEPLDKEEYAQLRTMGLEYAVVDMMAHERNMHFIEYLGYATGWSGGIPYMLFFDRNGRYRANHYGIVSYETLKKAIEQLYNTAPESTKEPKSAPAS